MKIKSILIIAAIVSSTVFMGFIVSRPVFAAEEPPTCGGIEYDPETQGCCNDIVTDMVNVNCSGDGGGITALILMVINILTAAVGIAAVGGVIWGSVLYTTAAGSPEKTKKGITIITDVVIGLVAFAAMWAILNFFIPGGAFNSVPTIPAS